MSLVYLGWLVFGCSLKKDDPELLLPPLDYDADVLNQDGYQLCLDVHPATAQVRVSSREVTGCIQVKGEAFVEVEAAGFVSYRELLQVKGDLHHQVILLPDVPNPDISEPSIPTPKILTPELGVERTQQEGEQTVEKPKYPMPKLNSPPAAFTLPSDSVELCVRVIPNDVYLRINGIKRSSGACMIVQHAAEISVEREGFTSFKQLISIPPKQSSPYKVVLDLSTGTLREDTEP